MFRWRWGTYSVYTERVDYVVPTGQSLIFPTAPAFLRRSPNLLGWRVSPLSCIVRDWDLKHNYTLVKTPFLIGEYYQAKYTQFRCENVFSLYLHGNKVGKKQHFIYRDYQCHLLITNANSLDPDQADKMLGLIWIQTD